MKAFHLRAFGFRFLIHTLILTTTLACAFQTNVRAMIAPAQLSEQGASSGIDRRQDMQSIQKALESKMVRQRLKDLGLSDQEIQTRLNKLSDRQVHQLASQIHTLNAGGEGEFLIGVLVVALLVLLIIYIAKRV